MQFHDRLEALASLQLILTLAIGLAVRADTEARNNPSSDSNLTMNKVAMAALLVTIQGSVFAFCVFALVQELRKPPPKKRWNALLRTVSKKVAPKVAAARYSLAAAATGDEEAPKQDNSTVLLLQSVSTLQEEIILSKAQVVSLEEDKEALAQEVAVLKVALSNVLDAAT